MDFAYALKYQDLYRRHWWWRARERLILRTIEEVRLKDSTESILDIGCGDGLLFDQLSQFGDVEGIEADSSLISAQGPWRRKIHISPFDENFRPEKRYSLILMLDVLEHFHDAGSCLKGAMELLDASGTVILTVPAFPLLWTSHDDVNKHFTRYTKKSLNALASEVQMRVLKCHYFFHWTFVPKLLLHFKERFFGAGTQLPRVPCQWVNETLLKFSIAEQILFRNACIPIGSSIIAVGRHW
jgi:2-polyprenyl-3-methyl-5-hydroxy-6-metoxy-1,4-benzoquinol methylase